jgi:hypothetical protein
MNIFLIDTKTDHDTHLPIKIVPVKRNLQKNQQEEDLVLEANIKNQSERDPQKKL